VEAFAGAAVQAMFLEKIAPRMERDNLGVLVVHALNPYGFKYRRRVTENNVDLNRNFSLTPETYREKNASYQKLNDFLNPKTKVMLADPFAWFLELRGLVSHVLLNTSAARAAILVGQYEYPKGVYFGGNAEEPNYPLIDRLLVEKTFPYKEAYLIDLHTGYGTRGVQHFWGNAVPSEKAAAAEKSIYAGFPIERAEGGTFYKISGDFGEYFGKRFESQLGVAMTFEYGTLNTETTSGSLDALFRVKLENQGHHWGYGSSFSERHVKRLFLEGYFPSAAEWQEAVLKQAESSLKKIVERTAAYAP
jgi:hypothetical protein